MERKPITVFGDGSQTRGFCYVDDLIRGLIALQESGEHLPVQIGNPHEFTLLELAEKVLEIWGGGSEIVFGRCRSTIQDPRAGHHPRPPDPRLGAGGVPRRRPAPPARRTAGSARCVAARRWRPRSSRPLCSPCPRPPRRAYIQRGIFDDAQILYGDPDKVFPTLKTLKTQLIRVNLVWGGVNGVAKRRPANPANPNDRAYDWSVYDRTVNYAAQYGIKVVFSIIGTPPWANSAAGVNRGAAEPARPAALRGGGRDSLRGQFRGARRRLIPPVRQWLAWSEPNNPAFLRPQYRKVGLSL